MTCRRWLPLVRLALSAGLVCLACDATAQQAATPPNVKISTQTASETEPVRDAVRVDELIGTAPAVSIGNGMISARVYLPDAQKGFYRGSRFDWAGVIGSLTYRGHDFYVPWFQAMSPSVRDIAYQDGAAIASINTAATGPVEEFNADGGALGYGAAVPGGVFIKIGVGVLRRPDDAAYSAFRRYSMVDAGKRRNFVKRDSVEFVHEVADPGSGYAYQYTKTLRLIKGQPVLVLEHVLRNTGARRISTMVYNHNFLNIDGAGTTPGLELRAAFPIGVDRMPDPALAAIDGRTFIYRAAPTMQQRIMAKLTGFGTTAADNDFHVVDSSRGLGLQITGDQPLAQAVLWSIRPVMAIEPFIAMAIDPGQSFTWSNRYQFSAK